MEILASDRAIAFIRERGGEAWVWLDVRRCCSGAVSYLGASTREPSERRGGLAHRFETSRFDDIAIHASLGARRPPDELHIDLRGRVRPRIEAYWNGCIFVDDRGPAPSARPVERHAAP